MKTVEKCCCCISLSKGVILIGWFKIIVAILISVQVIYTTVKDKLDDEEAVSKAGWVFYLFLTKKVIINIFVVLLSAFLIAGVKRRNPNFVLPWLIFTVVVFILNILSLLRFLEVPDLKLFIEETVLLCFTIYFWICVYSLYRILRQEQVNNKMSWRMHTAV